MPAAPIIGGVIGAVGAVGGAAIGAKAQKKAAAKAAAAQQQTASDNNALQRETYAKNEKYLSPFVSRGNQAGAAIMELLGFDPAPQPAQPTQPANALAPQGYGGYSPYEPNYGPHSGQQFGMQVSQTPVAAPQQTAMSAFDRYRASDGYQFRQNEGLNALASNFRGRGVSQSGAADKALIKFGQDYGSNEFGKYLGYLSNQQGVGLAGASALAGVGQNYANSVSANNQNAADAISNAALLKGQSTAGIFGTAANALGNIGGQLVSSYGRNSMPDQPYYGMSGGGIY